MFRLNLPSDKELAQAVIASENKKHELSLKIGLLGRLFGTGPEASMYIVGVITILLVLAGIFYTIFPNNATNALSVRDFWQIITPIITGLTGFLFGRSSKK